jgi:response regulator RpfG family c-di-GMP phosphodiesterase
MVNVADLEAVIVTCDPQLLHTVTESLHNSGVEAVTFDDVRAATDYISRRKVDAVIIDSEVDGAKVLLKKVRETPSNSQTPTFATVHSRELYGELAASAHFIIEKPLSQEHFDRALRAAHNLMLLERRRYHRQAVEVPVIVARSSGERLHNAMLINVSEHGLALRCEGELRRQELLEVQFILPRVATKFQCSVEVIWADKHGLGGVRFLSLDKRQRSALSKWIDRELGQRRGHSQARRQ